jgi:SWI/SNF-related matrix-associated actin-dependent regulator 1 of chromatin subfamily A
MRAFSNKYKGKCDVCRKLVQPGQGFICKDGGFVKSKHNSRYTAVWCAEHVPVRKDEKAGAGVRKLDAQGRCITPYEADNLDLIRSFPGARWKSATLTGSLGKPYWQVSLEMCDRRRVLDIADKLGLDVDPSLREIAISEQAGNAKQAGLYPFQVTGVEWLNFSLGKSRLLADEMGLGKTVQSLVALPENAACLVVCPAALKYNWETECRKWRPDLTPVVLEGRNSFRFPKPGEVIITNFDILPAWLEPKLKTPTSKPWDVVVKIPLSAREACKSVVAIVDECQRVKNGNTGRAKRIKGLVMVTGTVWALTGTPLENRPMDLWGILSTLGMARTVFGSFDRFIESMNGCKGLWGGYTFGTPKPIVPDLMRRVMLRRRREVVLPELPRKQYHTIKVDLPKHLQRQMDDLWDEWEETIKEKELPPFEEFSSLRAALAESRIPALLEMVEDHEEQGVPLVVFSAHKAPVLACGEREGWEGITGDTSSKKRQEIVERFQRGELKGLALTIRAGGVGLNLTHAWKAIFVDLDWVPSQNSQAEDRICRIGQLAAHCEIIRMVSDHVLDLHVLDLIAWKIGVIEAAIENIMPGSPRQAQEVETAEVYEARMIAAELVKAAEDSGIVIPDSFDERLGIWPEIELDADVPF